VAAGVPAIYATMNRGTSAGRMPAKVSDRERATATAGSAKEGDDLNLYAAVM